MKPTPDESQLLAAVAASDRRAFTELYSAYLTGLQRYIFLFTHSEELAQELTQQVFIGLWERRQHLTGVTHLRAYLYRAAKNLVFDEVRRQQRQASAYAELHAAAPSPASSADSELISQQYQEQAQALISQLPVKRREIFLLRTQEELSLDEIATQLTISKSVVKKQLYAALEFMKKRLLPTSQASVPVGVLWLVLQSIGG
ncbi:sigma-70 family RNA polymerase sigma factor [Hymenobacter sp. YC55]|uniref:RNA polymerase sigma factor n=1 Tax=Hymenobacter sp. YC55 TaxID=3034019 RepID=UPI0023F6E732|nr:sigma-70 family RNA polymerase sigma factor [Hymenobacter sp. YC55]MDF7813977.1 sigma-70 family RNA polymerase sigma factor [Hymenobacter sp. YC55]